MLDFSFSTDRLLELLYRLPAVLIALSFHEWAHAYAAYKCGDPTARNMGRMTMNPFAHIDIIGFIMMILVRFGWAKPVPVNPRNFEHPRKEEVIVSLAGVTTNLILAFLGTGVFYLVFVVIGWQNEIVINMLSSFRFINVGLFVFNLLPIPPLDGYRVVQALFMRRIGTRVFIWLERYGSILLLAIFVLGRLSILPSWINPLSWITALVDCVITGIDWVWSAIFSLFM